VFDRHARLAFLLACAALVLSGIGFQSSVRSLNVYLKKDRVDLRRQFGNIPRTLGRWQAIGTDIRFDEASVEELGTDQYLVRRYAVDGDARGEQMAVHLAYYTGMIDAVPHVPDRCLVAAGLKDHALPVNLELPLDRSAWRDDPEHVNRATGLAYPLVETTDPLTGRRQDVRLPVSSRPIRLRTSEFRHLDDPNMRIFAGYLFVANGRAAAAPEAVRSLAFDKTDRYAYYAKVQFTMYGGKDLTVDRFVASVADLADHLLPELMLCLPDWSEVEQRED
jgi:hypothetical protein